MGRFTRRREDAKEWGRSPPGLVFCRSMKFFLREPSDSRVGEFLRRCAEDHYSYPEVGNSREGTVPRGYVVDFNRARIGRGREDFERASRMLLEWRMFDLGWVRIRRPEAPRPGLNVCVQARAAGLWTLNGCRVVYCVDADGPLRKSGFAYGTLREHAERGEERFLVEWDTESDEVFFEIFAFSRPGSILTRIGFPVARFMQRKFARGAMEAMRCFSR